MRLKGMESAWSGKKREVKVVKGSERMFEGGLIDQTVKQHTG